jgi:hypothetical protein
MKGLNMEDGDIYLELGQIKEKLRKIDILEQDVKDIKFTLNGWVNKVSGGMVVLSIIGSIVIYLGHDLFVLIRTKLGF